MTRVKQAHNQSPDQVQMFGANPTRAVARRDARATSKEAAAKVNLPKKAAIVVALLREFGPMTDEEINDRARDQGHFVSNTGFAPARCMITPPNGQGVIDSGEVKINPSGRKAVVWKLDPDAVPGKLPSKIAGLRGSQRQVYDAFERHGDMTHGELAFVLTGKMEASSARTRCHELVELELVEKKGQTEDEVSVWGLK